MTQSAQPVAKSTVITFPQPYPPKAPWDVAAHLDAILHSLSDHEILSMDVAGNVTSLKCEAATVSGYTQEEIVGRHLSVFYSRQDQDAALPAHALRLAGAIGKHESEGWRFRKSGEQFWAHDCIHRVIGNDGALQGFVKVSRDISHRLQAEKLREELYQSQKLEMVGQLTGGIAHDFNNLLTTIETAHDLVLNYCADARVSRVIGVSKGAVDTSRKLISQLLAFARRQVLKPKSASVWDMVSNMDALVKRAVGESVQLRWSLQPELANVMVDQPQFQSMLLNLVVNARDAMPAGGTLTVFMQALSLSTINFMPPYDVPAGDYIVLGVSDTGVGLTPELQARAIEPFFTTKEVGRGSGLGLSQCFGFARQSGGTLRIESAPGIGTTVKILLPSLATPAVVAASGTPHRTVLLVEDDANVRALAGAMLTSLGHNVVQARDAPDALDCLRNNAAIDYLFTDIVMPNGMNGVQLMNTARIARPGLPALLATGYSRDALHNLGDVPEDVAFIKKPYSLADVHAHMSGRHLA